MQRPSNVGRKMLNLLVVMATAALHIAGAKSSSCSVDYNLNYTISMRVPCPRKEVSNGTFIQTIPKSFSSGLPGNLNSGCASDEDPRLRLCRVPDCSSNPCQHGWCEETRTSFRCHCHQGFRSRLCDKVDGGPLPTGDVPVTIVTVASASVGEGVQCGSVICVNGGKCGTTDGNVKCQCPQEYAGEDCGTEPLETRLAGGSGAFIGRVEVYYQESWGTVCDDGWDMVTSNVVCRSLGYAGATEYYTGAYEFGEGTGDIILDEVECVGTETNIAFCPHAGYGNHNCRHDEDVAVICAESPVTGSGGGDLCGSKICLNGGQCDVTNDDPICTCPAGYEGVDCVTASPAPTDGVACGSLLCLNGGECNTTAAGHQCDCPSGYTGVTCALDGGDDAVTGKDKIFLTDITARNIYVADLGTYTFTALNKDDDPIEARDITFDETNQKLYWTNKTDNKIYRGNWDMTERIPVSSGKYSDPTSISIDESRGQIYCAYSGDHVISRIDLDNPDSEIDLFNQLTRPSAVEVDETNGFLYFTQTGRVHRWNYNYMLYSYDTLYINLELNDIDAIAIEVPANRLIVCDYGNAKVIRMDLNGDNPSEVAILSNYKISDILIYKGDYYMSHLDAEEGEMTILKYILDSASLLDVFTDSDHLFGVVKKIQLAHVEA